MERTIICVYQNGDICSVFRVANPDSDFIQTLDEAEQAWNTADGINSIEADYDSFVLKYMTNRGYKMNIDNDFQVYQTCM